MAAADIFIAQESGKFHTAVTVYTIVFFLKGIPAKHTTINSRYIYFNIFCFVYHDFVLRIKNNSSEWRQSNKN